LNTRERRQLTVLLDKVRSNLEAARDNSSTARRLKLNSAKTSF
jgi:hypothetical protein